MLGLISPLMHILNRYRFFSRLWLFTEDKVKDRPLCLQARVQNEGGYRWHFRPTHGRDGLTPEDLIPDSHQVFGIMGVFGLKEPWSRMII